MNLQIYPVNTAVVCEEHTLGVICANGAVQPLRAMTTKGAPFSVFEYPFTPMVDKTRPATLDDFDEYRVRYHPEYKLIKIADGFTRSIDERKAYVKR